MLTTDGPGEWSPQAERMLIQPLCPVFPWLCLWGTAGQRLEAKQQCFSDLLGTLPAPDAPQMGAYVPVVPDVCPYQRGQCPLPMLLTQRPARAQAPQSQCGAVVVSTVGRSHCLHVPSEVPSTPAQEPRAAGPGRTIC